MIAFDVTGQTVAVMVKGAPAVLEIIERIVEQYPGNMTQARINVSDGAYTLLIVSDAHSFARNVRDYIHFYSLTFQYVK